ncbi:MAG: ammonium transporter [Eubacterium sp.]|nr:ammonium transporter [Eubacterium sp.]
MTNREWLEQKKDKINEKTNDAIDWILNNLWCPIGILGIVIGMILIGAAFIDPIIGLLAIPLCMFEYLFVDLAIEEWLDKEHKEREVI